MTPSITSPAVGARPYTCVRTWWVTRIDQPTQVGFVDEIISRMPTVADTERLVLSTVTPLAEAIRIGYALDRTPIHVMVTVYEVGVS